MPLMNRIGVERSYRLISSGRAGLALAYCHSELKISGVEEKNASFPPTSTNQSTDVVSHECMDGNDEGEWIRSYHLLPRAGSRGRTKHLQSYECSSTTGYEHSWGSIGLQFEIIAIVWAGELVSDEEQTKKVLRWNGLSCSVGKLDKIRMFMWSSGHAVPTPGFGGRALLALVPHYSWIAALPLIGMSV